MLMNLASPLNTGELLGPGILSLYPILLGVYIFALTLLSELEHRSAMRWEMLFGSLLIGLALLAVIVCNLSKDELNDYWIERNITAVALFAGSTLVLGGWSLYRLGKVLIPALRLAKKNLIGPFMVRGLSGIIYFDALIVVGFRPELTPLVLALLIPFFVLGRLARMD